MNEVCIMDYEQKTKEELIVENMQYENEMLRKQLEIAKDDIETANNVIRKTFRKNRRLKKEISLLNKVIFLMEHDRSIQA